MCSCARARSFLNLTPNCRLKMKTLGGKILMLTYLFIFTLDHSWFLFDTALHAQHHDTAERVRHKFNSLLSNFVQKIKNNTIMSGIK